MSPKVAKVTSDRAYSVACLPSSSAVVVAVGDKSGNLGIWNYSNQKAFGNDGVSEFSPHSATVGLFAKFIRALALLERHIWKCLPLIFFPLFR